MLSHISKHLSINDIIINPQHGFGQKFSCETQLISAINDWAKSINRRTQTDVILLDFSKAFDTVPHQRLISKLNFYGIRDRSLDWIKAFLTDRTQVVSINGTHSNPSTAHVREDRSHVASTCQEPCISAVEPNFRQMP